jgi:hypothetical protein
MQLRHTRANFETFIFCDLFTRLEHGNLDYSIFRHQSKIKHFIGALRNMFTITEAEPAVVKQISHVSAMICAGWIKTPDEPEFW